MITTDRVEDHELMGLHATLKTFVVGVPDIDPAVARVSYASVTHALLGHDQIVAELTREILKAEAMERYGIARAVVEGWL